MIPVFKPLITIKERQAADKLKLCEVDIGTGNLAKVVCGAQNEIGRAHV